MNRLGILIILVLWLAGTSIEANDYIDSVKIDNFLRLQGALYNDQFDKADSLCTWYVDRHPEDPAGYLFRAAIILSQMMDREEDYAAEKFGALLDTVDVLTARVSDTASANTTAWMHLLRGHARVYRALRAGRFGSLTSSVRNGLAARNEYETGLRFDSTVYDLYFGLGAFHYWKSVRAGILRWLGIFKNEIDKGISEIYLAADSSLLSREASRNALIWIWLDRKEYDSAAIVSEQMSEQYPLGKVFLWPLGEALFQKRKYRRALATYQTLREQIALEPGNRSNLIECDYRLYLCYDALGLEEQAVDIAKTVNSYYESIPKRIRSKHRSKLRLFHRIARL